MKKTMTTIAALVCCIMTLMAEPVSPAAARQTAARFLQQKGAKLESQAMEAPRRAMGQTANGQEASPYYVFNATGKKGFVVVSGDDCVGDNLVLGYTDQGSFDADNIPVNMQDWLDGMASQISTMSRLGVKNRAVALHDAVAPLLTSTWGQGQPTFDPTHPYNALCPPVNGQLSCTGCMATAMSQVLYYYRWPQEPIVGDLPGYQTFSTKTDMETLPSVKFDWDNMLDNYNGETTEAQQKAVATLMRYCGQTLQMDYTPSISNAYAYDIDMLINQFGIDQGVHLAKANEHSITAWDSLLYTELKEQRPLLHAGFSMGGGHAFVLDGYEVKDSIAYYHVNWGWDGESDGFYRLDVLNPYASGTGGSSTSDGFAINQEALIGFQPAKSPLENYGRYLVSFSWNVSYDNKPLHFSVFNSSYMPVNYTIAMAERQADGTIDYDHILGEQTLETVGYSYAVFQEDDSPMLKYITLPDHVADGLAPGSHRLVFINKETGTDAPWRPLFGSNCSIEIIVGDDGQPTDTIVHPYPVLSSNARSVKVVGLGGLDDMKMWGIKQTVEATITNKSDDAFNGPLFCTLYLVNNEELLGAVKLYQAPLFIEANSKANIQFDIYPPQKGDYVALISYDYQDLRGHKVSSLKNVDGYIGQKNVTAKELTFSVLNMDYDVEPNQIGVPTAYLDFTLSNNTVMDYDAYILVNIYKRDKDDVYRPIVFPTGVDYCIIGVNVGSCQRIDKRLYLDQVLEPGEYMVYFQMASDFYGKKLSDYFVFSAFDLEIEDVTGIKAVDSDQPTSGQSWFSLDGRRLDARPTTKGIYVHKGRKYVVK